MSDDKDERAGGLAYQTLSEMIGHRLTRGAGVMSMAEYRKKKTVWLGQGMMLSRVLAGVERLTVKLGEFDQFVDDKDKIVALAIFKQQELLKLHVDGVTIACLLKTDGFQDMDLHVLELVDIYYNSLSPTKLPEDHE